jgi:Tol biopolymer transport system component
MGQIAFTCTPDLAHSAHDICVSRLDGSGLRRLTTNSTETASGYPDWSPDGKQILFQQEVPGAQEGGIWIMNLDGSGKTELIPNAGAEPV